MKQSETVAVKILDKEYHLVCPTDKRTKLQQTADYLDKLMREIRSSGKAIGVERIAVTAALNVVYQLLEKEVPQKTTNQPTKEQPLEKTKGQPPVKK